MKTWTIFCLLILFCGVRDIACVGDKKLKLLVITGGHDFEEAQFWEIFKSNPDIEITTALQKETSEAYDRDDLLSYDVVVLYDMVQKITNAQTQQFMSLFEKGVGLVAMHHCLASYQDWPEFEKIIGGKYLMEDEIVGETTTPKSDFKHDVDMPIEIVAGDHPITAGLSNFTIHDEIYIGYRVQPDVTPLLRTTQSESGNPVTWCHEQGKSRVVYIQLGHDHRSYENPNFRRLVAQSIHWAANR